MTPLDVVVTNDDGIDSPGVHALAAAVESAGHRVRVIAPTLPASGAGGGIAVLTVPLERLTEPRKLGLVTAGLAVAAEPAMISLWAVLGCFGRKPDLILSGINLGSNLGSSVVHSGTFCAALTAVMHGTPAIAVSLCFDDEDKGHVDPILHWDAAAQCAVALIDHARAALENGFAINLNVPNMPAAQLEPPLSSRWAPAGLVPSVVPFVDRIKAMTVVSDAALTVPGPSEEHSRSVLAAPPLPGSDRDIVGSGRASVGLIGLIGGDVESVLGIAVSSRGKESK